MLLPSFVLLVFLVPQCLSSMEKKLIKTLLANYSAQERPVRNYSHAIQLRIGFSLIQIMNIVEKDQYITTKLWMRMFWKNEFLQWDPAQWENITHTRLTKKYVWTPDIFLQEDIGDDISSGPASYQTPIVAKYDGEQQWFIPVKIMSSCAMDVTYFPFDRQTCKFVFNSWTHDQKEVDIEAENKTNIDSNYINSTEWDLISIDRKVTATYYSCCPNPFVDITFTLNLKRKPSYYIYNIVLPCVVQMLIILFTFFLPAESGERIGVVITVLLVFAVYLQIVSESLPKSSTTTPTLAHFYITSMVESAMSLIATCFVLAIHFKGAKKGVEPIPGWLREYGLIQLGKLLWFNVSKFEESEPRKTSAEKMNLLTQTNDSQLECNGNKDGKNMDLKHSENVGLEIHDLEVLKELRRVTSYIKDMDESDAIAEEWETLTSVIDRLMFFCFLIIFTISSLIILLPAAQANYGN